MDLLFTNPLPPETQRRIAIGGAHRQSEPEAVAAILAAAALPAAAQRRIAQIARRLVSTDRAKRLDQGGIDAFLHEYALSTPEGVALMCLAEALLRSRTQTPSTG